MKYSLLILLMLSGCGDVDGYVVERAIQECTLKGGIHHIIVDAWQRHVVCNDGSRWWNIGEVNVQR